MHFCACCGSRILDAARTIERWLDPRGIRQCQPKTFSNKQTGVRGSVKVTGSGGQECRTEKQEMKLKGGTALTDTVSACKGPNGTCMSRRFPSFGCGALAAVCARSATGEF